VALNTPYLPDGGARAAANGHDAGLQAIDEESVVEQRLGRFRRWSQDHSAALRRRPDTRPRAEGGFEPRLGLPQRVRGGVGGTRPERRRAQTRQGAYVCRRWLGSLRLLAKSRSCLERVRLHLFLSIFPPLRRAP
jgi:hypothetical protein